MLVKCFHITSKAHRPSASLDPLVDFTYVESDPVELQTIVSSPAISLYGLDLAHRQVIFVETAPDVDLLEFPFYQWAQFKNAERLLLLSYEDFYRLMDDIDDKPLIFIQSVGRCGSTLLNNIFNTVESVFSYSEPDVFTQLLSLRATDGTYDPELPQLLRSCVRAFCKPSLQRQPQIWGFKLRSYCIHLADLIYDSFPHSKTIFLYRNAVDWLHSYARTFGIFGSQTAQMARMMPELATRFIPLLRDYLTEPLNDFWELDLAILNWLDPVLSYLKFQQQGLPMLAARYEELNTMPQATITEIFDYCNLPINVSVMTAALKKDSQQGTRYARDKVREKPEDELNEHHIMRLRQILSEYTLVQDPNVILPGTCCIHK